MLWHLGGVLAELARLQAAERGANGGGIGAGEPSALHGVDVSRSAMFRDARVLEAARFAARAHEGQARRTGEPYVAHCVEAALIVERNLPPRREDAAEAERHRDAVIAALLHDALDDAAVAPADLEARFGPRVASMVAQVSKLSAVNQMLRRDKRRGVISPDPAYWQSTWRRLRRMMVEAVVAEPLVVLVKLADRLHNMRTLYSLPRDKQLAVAEETLQVWCSVAGCLGWHALRSEMEDLCFAVLDEDAYCALRQRLDALWAAPPAPRRRRARDSGRRRQLEAAAERHERQREERREERRAAAAAAAAQGASAWQPLAGLWGGGGGAASSSAASASASASSAQPAAASRGGSAAAVAERPPAVATVRKELPSPPQLQQQSQPQPQQLQQQRIDGRVVTVLAPAESPAPAAAAAAEASSWGGDTAVAPPPLSWEAEGWGPDSGGPSLVSLAVAATAAAKSPPPPPLPGAAPLTAQQQQLRAILSTVVPFDAVGFKSAADLSWSAQRGLALLDAAASQLYTELSVGSFGSGLGVVIQGRLKSLHSVHRKMQRKRCALEEVYDARALRVIVDDCGGARLGDAVQCCYRLVAAVHKLWRPIDNEYDDYVANVRSDDELKGEGS